MNKLLKNVLASALPQIMNIITNLILPTMIITRFGSEMNGLISSTKVLISYIGIIGSGIATAVTQALYIPVANKDNIRTKGMLHAADKMFNKFGSIYCVIVIIVAFIYPFTLDTSIKYSSIVLLMVIMSVSGASEFFVVGRCRALLYANQKTYICTLIQAASLLGSLVLAVLALVLDYDILIVQFAISFVYVIRAFLLLWYVRKNYPELNDYRKIEPINSAIEKKNDAMIHQISGLAVNSSQTTVLTIFLGLNAASIYSIYNIVFSGLQSVCANICIAVTPFLGKEHALNNKERLLKMYDIFEYAVFTTVIFIYSIAMMMIVPFVELYTKGADINYIFPIFAAIFVFSSAFYILKMPSNALINVSGKFKETRLRAIIEALLTVIVSIIFVNVVGINGVVIGTGVAFCWRCIDTIVYTNKNVLGCSNFKSMFRLFRVILIIFLVMCIGRVVNIEVTDFVEWIKYVIMFSPVVMCLIIINSLLFDFKTLKAIFYALKNSSL